MADDLVTIEANAATAHAAIDRLLELAPARIQAAARISADNIQAEARRRVRRRTGQTAAGIVVREAPNSTGYQVIAEGAPGDPQTHRGGPAVPVWLEFGATSMRFGPKPFLLVSGKLEAAAHEQRIREALQSAIADAGLGD
jgi:hypothetical protein